MSNLTYSEKLKHPKWQRKRLDILSRDNFKCQHCGSDENSLHVHHKYYTTGAEPWDYDNSALITLCYDCHEVEEIELSAATCDIITVLKQAGAEAKDFKALSECFIFMADGLQLGAAIELIKQTLTFKG